MTDTEEITPSDMTDEQYAERFALVEKRCRELATSFATPVGSGRERLPLYNTLYWPVATEAICELVPSDELVEYAGMILLMLADHLRREADLAANAA